MAVGAPMKGKNQATGQATTIAATPATMAAPPVRAAST